MQKTLRRMNKQAKPVVSGPLTEAPEDKMFWNHDGKVFRTLKDLAQGLRVMSDETYSYHAGSRNDYATWVREVLNDTEVSRRLAQAMNREEAIILISGR